jgi:hypothetical protein
VDEAGFSGAGEAGDEEEGAISDAGFGEVIVELCGLVFAAIECVGEFEQGFS